MAILEERFERHRARLRLKEAMEDGCRFYRDGENVFRGNRKR